MLPDEICPADNIFKQLKTGKVKFISTYLLPFEVLNSLKCALKQKRISVDQTKILSRRFLELEIELLPVEFESVFNLANKKNLTVYDAGYLWLAKSKKTKLQTFDEQLKKFPA